MKRNEGFALVISLVVIVAVAIVVLGGAFTTLIDRQISSNQQGANASYYVAQAGLAQYKTLIFKNLVDYYSQEGQGWCASPVAPGIRDGFGQIILADGATSSPAAFGPGTYQVTFQVRDTYMILTSVGRVGKSQTALQLVATAGGGPAGAWDNAILAAGTTPGSKAINGNVSVYGSVHIVRGDLTVDNSGLALGGGAGIYNTYLGDGTGKSDASAAMAGITGDGNVDLCARLKVKSGSVYLESGASVLGSSVPNGELYSVHLGNGRVYNGKPTSNPTEITDHADSSLVNLRYPVSGMNSGYDGYDIELPVLSGSYPNDVPSFTVTAADCPWLVSGAVIRLPPSAVGTCGDANGSIAWNSGGYLEISGSINTGPLDVTVIGDIEYSGKGSIRVGSGAADASALFSVYKSSITPRGGGYPTVNALAVVSSGDVEFSASGTGGFSPIAAMIYAADKATFEKQVLIAGSIIANTFDMGKNVPKIAYHPDIRNVAEELCLVGSFCYGGEIPPNPGILSDISVERRDTAAID